MDYKPKGNKVLIKPDTIEEFTRGGLVIPDRVREDHGRAITRGEIVAIGPDASIQFSSNGVDAQEAKIGDRVIYAKYSGAEFRYDNEIYRVIFDDDILLLIGDEKEPLADSRKIVEGRFVEDECKAFKGK